MKTITQLKEEIKALMKASADIDAQCVAENRGLKPEEKTLKTEILDTVQELSDEVKVREREERMQAFLEKPEPTETKPGPQGKKPPATRDKDRFASFGEQMAAVMRAGLPNAHIDPRLFNAAASGLSESVPSDGGLI